MAQNQIIHAIIWLFNEVFLGEIPNNLFHPDVPNKRKKRKSPITYSFPTFTSRRRFSHSSFRITGFGGYWDKSLMGDERGLELGRKTTDHWRKKSSSRWTGFKQVWGGSFRAGLLRVWKTYQLSRSHDPPIFVIPLVIAIVASMSKYLCMHGTREKKAAARSRRSSDKRGRR